MALPAEGLRDLRRGLLLMFISALVGFAFVATAEVGYVLAVLRAPAGGPSTALLSIPPAIVLLSAAVAMAGLLLYRRGLAAAALAWPDISVGKIGAAMLAAGTVVASAGLSIALASLSAALQGLDGAILQFVAGEGVALVGGLVGLAGHILALVVVSYRFYSRFRDGMYLAAFILYIILPLAWIGHLLFYLALGRLQAG